MIRLLGALLLIVTISACGDTRIPPTMSNPTGDPEVAAQQAAAHSGQPVQEEHGFFWHLMPWHWF